jgi:hypothetical protein
MSRSNPKAMPRLPGFLRQQAEGQPKSVMRVVPRHQILFDFRADIRDNPAEQSSVPVWRLYLYGSYAKNTYNADSDIDLAVFWDRDDIDGFDEDVLLRKLCWDIELRIEPHSFARTDFDETDPCIREIIETGERIL